MSRLSSTLQWYLRRLGIACYRRQLVFYYRPPGPSSGDPALPGDFEFRFVGAGELEALHYPGGWLRLPEARSWLERGDREMLAAVRHGHICSYLWVERGMALIDYLDLDVPLPSGHVYISKVYVPPQWRRHGLASAMYRFFSSREPGVTAHSACVTENLPMHLLFSKLDWRVRLLFEAWKAGRLQRYRLEPVSGGPPRSLLTARDARVLLFSPLASAASA